MKTFIESNYPIRQNLAYLCMMIFTFFICTSCTKDVTTIFPQVPILSESSFADEYVGEYKLIIDADYSGHNFIEIMHYEGENPIVGIPLSEYKNRMIISNFLNQEKIEAQWNGTEFIFENYHMILDELPSIVSGKLTKEDECLRIYYLITNTRNNRACCAEFRCVN